MDRRWNVGQHMGVVSGLTSIVRARKSPVRTLISTVNGLSSLVCLRTLTELASPLTGLTSALTLLLSPLISPICWPTTQHRSK